MNWETALALIGSVRFATLGTTRPDGSAHLVPCVFAAAPQVFYLPIDSKPKRTRNLARVKNIQADPRAALLFHGWDEEWSRLWWIRIDGVARVLHAEADLRDARRRLLARYVQYSSAEELNPIIAVAVTAWAGWSASDGSAQ